MILVHLQTAPPHVKMVPEQDDTQILNNAVKSMFIDIAEISSAVAKRHNIPFDVVLARTISNLIANLSCAALK